MKLKTFFLILLSLFTGQLAFSQNLSELDTVVHYSLINTAVDEQGNYEDIDLVNSPFQGADGVYCNGIYIGSFDPDASLVVTPPLSEVYDTTFAISVDFRVDVAPEQISPIFICGQSWRYLGMTVQNDSTFLYKFNNTWTQIPFVKVKIGEWQNAACLYTMADSTATFWIDGQQVAQVTGALIRPDNDSQVSNTDGGAGFTFLGNLRNLVIYSAGGIISSTTPPWAESTARVYPNPTADKLIIEDAQYTSWAIYNLNGVEAAKGIYNQQQRINVSALAAGTYILTLRNDQQMIVHRQRFLKI